MSARRPPATAVAGVAAAPSVDDRLFWLALLIATLTQVGPALDRFSPDADLGSALIGAVALIAVAKVGRSA